MQKLFCPGTFGGIFFIDMEARTTPAEEIFEALIGGILAQQYGIADTFLPPEQLMNLRGQLLYNFENGCMQPAGIGKLSAFERNEQVRNDVIYWLDKANNSTEKAFLERVESFIAYLNRTCFTGINAYEFHYSYYDTGSFYKRHIDQFRNDSGRKFSLVVYLNENWSDADGGQLILYRENDVVKVAPEGGRAVFFKADTVEHEVEPASRPRLSIAGWLKSL